MAIGEFGGAPRCPASGSPLLSTPMYWLYEMGHAALDPSRAFADADPALLQESRSIRCRTRPSASRVAAAIELFERSTRRYGKPDWGIDDTAGRRRARAGAHHARSGSGRSAGCCISSARSTHAPRRPQPKLLIVAPMSGHYATLLRGTVEAFLPQPRRLHHRLDRCAHGAAVGGPLRSRRLHRLRHLDAALRSAATRMSSRCASRRCRCWPRSRGWKPRTIPTCRAR